jgi:hypothetical protein
MTGTLVAARVAAQVSAGDPLAALVVALPPSVTAGVGFSRRGGVGHRAVRLDAYEVIGRGDFPRRLDERIYAASSAIAASSMTCS